MFRGLFAVAVFFWASFASAQELPELQRHSKTTLSVFEGDKIKLAVKASGDTLLYRWVRQDKTFCREAKCVVDTTDWSLGKHSIVVVIYNRGGSVSVRYIVQVLAREDDSKPKTVRAEMVDATEIEAVGVDDLFVKALKGIGYSYHKAKVQVIGKLPRGLEWFEKVKAHSKGTIKFGKKAVEEHFVTAGSVVALQKTESGRRAIRLLRGYVRSRQLAPENPAWSLIVGKRLQIDTDATGDVILQREESPTLGETLSITVLRGNARVLYYQMGADGKPDMAKSENLVIPAGARVDFRADNTPSIYLRPNYDFTETVLRATSSQYFLERKEAKEKKQNRGEFITADIKSHREVPVETAMANGKAALDRQDYLLALEHLLPAHKDGVANFNYLILVSDAYYNLGVLPEASRFLLLAQKLNGKDPVPDFKLALVLIESHKWKKAIQALNSAESKGYEDMQAVHYYRGVADFQSKDMLSARNHFTYSLWNARNRELETSARWFLAEIGDVRPYGVMGGLAYGMDSNVYRLPAGLDNRNEAYLPEKGSFYYGYGKMYYNGFSGEDGYLRFGFDISKKGFLDSDLKDIGLLRQNLYADWEWMIGAADGGEGYLAFGFNPYIRLLSIGDERSDDTFGLNISFAAPQLWAKPELWVGYSSHNDPLPGRDDKLDPITLEVVPPSDRSSTLTEYGLVLQLKDTIDFDLGFDLTMASLKHEATLVTPDDFAMMTLGLTGDVIFTQSIQSQFGLGYVKTTYAESLDDRKDTATELNLDLRYSYNPSMYNNLSLLYTDQKSNRELGVYKRYELMLMFTLEL